MYFADVLSVSHGVLSFGVLFSAAVLWLRFAVLLYAPPTLFLLLRPSSSHCPPALALLSHPSALTLLSHSSYSRAPLAPPALALPSRAPTDPSPPHTVLLRTCTHTHTHSLTHSLTHSHTHTLTHAECNGRGCAGTKCLLHTHTCTHLHMH